MLHVSIILRLFRNAKEREEEVRDNMIGFNKFLQDILANLIFDEIFRIKKLIFYFSYFMDFSSNTLIFALLSHKVTETNAQ